MRLLRQEGEVTLLGMILHNSNCPVDDRVKMN